MYADSVAEHLPYDAQAFDEYADGIASDVGQLFREGVYGELFRFEVLVRRVSDRGFELGNKIER